MKAPLVIRPVAPIPVTRRPLAFMHMPRTGGTSISAAIDQRYGDKAFRVKSTSGDLAEIAAMVPRGVEVIHGHMNYGLHRHLPVRYATLLRDPVDRCVSHYQLYCKQRRNRREEPVPFNQFLDSKFARNLQCRFLAGVMSTYVPAPELFARAKYNLARFEIVGFFDDLEGFAQRLGIEEPLPRLNGELANFEPTDEERDFARERNATGYELYDWAREHFLSPHRDAQAA